MATASISLQDSADWLKVHSHYVDPAVRQGYDAVVDSVDSDAKRVEELESKLKCAIDFMTGDWEPTDQDRLRFITSIKGTHD